MPNILQVPVPVTTAAVIWSGRQSGVASLLFINQDLNNTVWIGQEPAITAAGPNTIPILPNGTFSGDASSPWYLIGSVAGTQPLVVVPNGQAYFLGLTQGLGNLVLPSIQSPNFVHGVSGWQVRKDGSVEFNNGVFRGTITNSGMYIYSGTPAAGNLVESTGIAVAGLDPIGLNAVLPGDTRYHNNGAGTWVAQNSTQSLIAQLYQATSPAGPWTFAGTSIGFTNEFTTQPFLKLTGNLIAFGGTSGSFTEEIWVLPSGDTTGAKDAANVTFALGAAQSVRLIGGIYYGNVSVSIPLGHSVRGPGWDTCRWNVTGAQPGFIIQNAGAFSTLPAALTGLQVDGTSAFAGACAAQIGDLTGIEADIWATNFTGGNNGILMLNSHWWTEQGKFKFRIQNCDGGVAFLVSGTGTSSWDRSEFDIEFIQGTAGQQGVVLASGTAGPKLFEAVLRIHGNFTGGASALGAAVINMVGSGAAILQSRVEIGVECAGGVIGPITINFVNSNNQVYDCTGIIEFFPSGGTPFTASNNNFNFWFDGPVLGDTTLLKGILLPQNAAQITVGFPAGWTGPVTVQVPRGDGWVHIDVQITVAAATVVTNGEVILTAAIPTWARPTGDKFVALILNQAMVPARVQSTGNLQYLGPGFTGPASLFGQMVYLNST